MVVHLSIGTGTPQEIQQQGLILVGEEGVEMPSPSNRNLFSPSLLTRDIIQSIVIIIITLLLLLLLLLLIIVVIIAIIIFYYLFI